MREMFEEIFWEVAEELGVTDWWVLFDSDDFEKVEIKIADEFGVSVLEMDVYLDWYNEMAQDL